MAMINSVLDLDDRTRLQTFQEIVDTLVGPRPEGNVIDLATFAPTLTDDGGALAQRRPLR